MKRNQKIKIGIGFVTGRKSFKEVVKTYVENWIESGLVSNRDVSLNLFVAYDLNYTNTKATDFTCINDKIGNKVDMVCFVDQTYLKRQTDGLLREGVISPGDLDLLFGEGYAKKRNAVLFAAMKKKMDYLFFIDDDEYPVAPIEIGGKLAWHGQQVLANHLKHIEKADFTNGNHCGYISPIPYIELGETLPEEIFKIFIEAISNDILNWDSIKRKMQMGGITYADPDIIRDNHVYEVEEIQGAKFLSGSNLCINLNSSKGILPFFNPPGARGEDAFLGTCLQNHRVLKVPIYTFHDGFSFYEHLLCGVLPEELKPVKETSSKVTDRFLKACIGWIRYKPLLLYITRRESYQEEIRVIKEKLEKALPVICKHFNRWDFMTVLSELVLYDQKVREHFDMFGKTKHAWGKIVRCLEDERSCAVQMQSVSGFKHSCDTEMVLLQQAKAKLSGYAKNKAPSMNNVWFSAPINADE